MRGLVVPRIHVFYAAGETWMAGTSPAMTTCLWLDMSETRSRQGDHQIAALIRNGQGAEGDS